jgi:signal transduction histidine kinase
VATALALFVLFQTHTNAGIAAAALSASITGIVVPLFCNLQSAALDIQWSVSTSMLPAALFHFSLVFPRERKLVKRSNEVLGFVYGFSGVLGALSIISIMQSRSYWIYVDRFVLLLIVCSWMTLLASSVHEMLSPITPLHKKRAEGTLIGSLMAIFLIVGWLLAWPVLSAPESASIITSLLMFSIAPLAYAVSKADIRDATENVYFLIGCVTNGLIVASASLGVAYLGKFIGGLEMPFGSAGMFWGVMFIVAGICFPIVRKLHEGGQPTYLKTLANWVEVHGKRMRSVRDIDVAINFLEEVIRESFNPQEIGIFLHGTTDAGNERARHVGTFDSALLVDWEHLLRGEKASAVIDLWVDELLDDPAASRLRKRGAALAASIKDEKQRYGVVFLGAPKTGALYEKSQLPRLADLCWQTALAIRSSELVDRLEANAVAAGQHRTATQIAHDLMSPLKSIALIADRAIRTGVGNVDRREFERVKNVAEEAQEVVASLVVDTNPSELRPLGEVIAEAAGTFIDLHRDRLLLRVPGDLPRVKGSDCVGIKRVLQNLLENAFHAIDDTGLVEVYARNREGNTIIDVIDTGDGLTEEARVRAFEWGYTTRNGGHGFGLTTCKALLEKFGGEIVLEESFGGGTQARVTIPDAALVVQGD